MSIPPDAHARRALTRLVRFTPIHSIVCAALLILAARSVEARSLPRITTAGNAVVVNKRIALKFATANGKSLPAERARAVANRLLNEAVRGLPPTAVRSSRSGKQWRVVVAGRTSLIQVTSQDGHINGSHPKALAQRWASQIRQALETPPVVLHPARIIIPLGETRVLKLGGYADGDRATHIVQNVPALQLINPPGTHHLTVRADQTGKAIVRVKVGNDEAACVVEVKKYAGRVPNDLVAEVTGVPSAPTELITSAANAVLRRAPVEPGAILRLDSPLRATRPILPGQSRTLTAKVVLKGSGYLTAVGTARIRVVNRTLPAQPAARLFYSNTPEHITRHTTLYSATLSDDAPTRIMFHHDNQMRGATMLAVTIANLSDKDVRLHLTPGFVAQGTDPAKVGYFAGQAFLSNAMKQRGEIWTLPAHTSMPLVLQRLARRETGSGIAQVRLIEPPAGARCRVAIESVSPTRSGFAASARNRLDPWRYTSPRPISGTQLAALTTGNVSETIYRPKRTLEATYVVGEKWVFVPLGLIEAHPDDPNADPKHADIIGDYGVLYDIHVTVQNPNPTSRTVSVIFAPGGGAAMAVFNIGGSYLSVPEIRPPHQKTLAQITLRPNETRTINVQTVPLGGSSYPANLIVR